MNESTVVETAVATVVEIPSTIEIATETDSDAVVETDATEKKTRQKRELDSKTLVRKHFHDAVIKKIDTWFEVSLESNQTSLLGIGNTREAAWNHALEFVQTLEVEVKPEEKTETTPVVVLTGKKHYEVQIETPDGFRNVWLNTDGSPETFESLGLARAEINRVIEGAKVLHKIVSGSQSLLFSPEQFKTVLIKS
jgi:hypothetical protein